MTERSSRQDCARCHSEHNGADFVLIRWQPNQKSFDHSQTGFALTGKHQGLDCARCHNAQRVSSEARAQIKISDPARTFLGLSSACTNCHEDKHRGQFDRNCAQCHNTSDWKAARQFNHAATKFPLTGGHARVACEKCHKPSADPASPTKFVGLAFGKCTDCHSDPHRQAFQQTCNSCHSTASWRQVSLAGKFDHSTTKYPLLGKHQVVGCTECHARGDFKKAVAHTQCADCHRPDPHKGQFATRADGGRCDSCHTVDGFKQATFTVAEHQKTGFPLRGKHATIECAKCHKPVGKATQFKIRFDRCATCHEDNHAGQFSGMPYENRCELCHGEQSYRPSTFNIARHQKTRFALSDSHLAVACNECHKPLQPVTTATPVIAYKFKETTCTACHEDPHRGQFSARMAKKDVNGAALGCQACHSMKTWSDMSRFDHETTGFLLTGAHRATPCAGCHRSPNLEVKLKNVDFRSAPKQCEDCHSDVHAAQFARSGVTRCSECHSTTRWTPSLFDHEKTSFSLRPAHEAVTCDMCHKNTKEVQGRSVVFYKPTPSKCAACHGREIEQPRVSTSSATKSR